MDPNQTTLGDALRATAADAPDRVGLIEGDRALSWAQVDAEVDRLAHLLEDLGVGPGEVVGLCIAKRVEVVLTLLAVARLGAIATPINFKLHPRRLDEQLELTGVRALLLESRYDAAIASSVRRVGDRVLYVGRPGQHGERCVAEAEHMPSRPFTRQVDPHDPVYYNLTSGTTGQPKAAVASHANLLWNARSGIEGLGFAPDDVLLGMFSVFSHPHELFHRALVAGATAVLLDTMNALTVARAVHRHRVTWVMAVPSFYEMMLDHVEPERFDLSSLRVVEAGGAWSPPRTLERIEERYGCTYLPVWGSTETHGVALALRPGPGRRAGATGRPVAHYQAELFGPGGDPIPDGRRGEMWVRGPAVADRYLGMPEQTARSFRDGWYRTGDLLTRDPDGLFHFVGRQTEMMKVGGIRVFPLEIEQVLLRHPDIAEAAVVAATERVRGEVPRAVIRAAQGAPVDAAEVRAWCRAHLAVYKVPRIIEFWGELPRLPNGKIDRRSISASEVRR